MYDQRQAVTKDQVEGTPTTLADRIANFILKDISAPSDGASKTETETPGEIAEPAKEDFEALKCESESEDGDSHKEDPEVDTEGVAEDEFWSLVQRAVDRVDQMRSERPDEVTEASGMATTLADIMPEASPLSDAAVIDALYADPEFHEKFSSLPLVARGAY